MLFSRITNQTHSTDIAPYIFSKFFERTAYYGMISFLFFRMMQIDILSREDILYYYDFFSTYLFVGILLGALLGDLIIGNKKAMLIGGITMIISIFMLSQPTANGFIYGLILVAIGNGLYAPNLLAGFAKQFKGNEKMFDASFILLMLAINLGGIIGPLLVFSYNKEDFLSSYWTAGTLMLIAVIIAFFTKEIQINKQNHKSFTLNLPRVLAFIITTGIFWYLLNGYVSSVSSLNFELQEKTHQISSLRDINYFINFSVILSIILALVFSFFYIDRYVKIIIGISLSLIAFNLLFSINLQDIQNFTKGILFSNFAMALAELLITPTLYALVNKFGSPKYYAIYFALMYVPIYILTLSFGRGYVESTQEAYNFYKFASIPALVILLFFIVLFWQSRRKNN